MSIKRSGILRVVLMKIQVLYNITSSVSANGYSVLNIWSCNCRINLH